MRGAHATGNVMPSFTRRTLCGLDHIFADECQPVTKVGHDVSLLNRVSFVTLLAPLRRLGLLCSIRFHPGCVCSLPCCVILVCLWASRIVTLELILHRPVLLTHPPQVIGLDALQPFVVRLADPLCLRRPLRRSWDLLLGHPTVHLAHRCHLQLRRYSFCFLQVLLSVGRPTN